jgi:hypothetical protein
MKLLPEIKQTIKWAVVYQVFTIIALITGVVGLWFNYLEIKNTRLNQSAELVLKFEEYFEKDLNQKIIEAIEGKKPILVKNGGFAKTIELDSYLGKFETISNLYGNKLLKDDMLYSSYSYLIDITYENQEIREYINEVQAEDPEYYAGFMDMATIYK